jgi:hypothetical protein
LFLLLVLLAGSIDTQQQRPLEVAITALSQDNVGAVNDFLEILAPLDSTILTMATSTHGEHEGSCLHHILHLASKWVDPDGSPSLQNMHNACTKNFLRLLRLVSNLPLLMSTFAIQHNYVVIFWCGLLFLACPQILKLQPSIADRRDTRGQNPLRTSLDVFPSSKTQVEIFAALYPLTSDTESFKSSLQDSVLDNHGSNPDAREWFLSLFKFRRFDIIGGKCFYKARLKSF